jgi:predicted AAA+ superfamily ATPase
MATFLGRYLIPWSENITTRQVRSPKIYFRDSGILHALIGIHNATELDVFPRLGSFWEGFALEEIIKFLGLRSEECFFWATHADAELDLFVILHGKRIGFEFKYADAPKTTKSMRVAITDLKLDHLFIIYPGIEVFPMDEKIIAYGLNSISKIFDHI